MKLNFWQWLGLVLLMVGLALWVYEHKVKTPPQPATTPGTLSTAPAQ